MYNAATTVVLSSSTVLPSVKLCPHMVLTPTTSFASLETTAFFEFRGTSMTLSQAPVIFECSERSSSVIGSSYKT